MKFMQIWSLNRKSDLCGTQFIHAISLMRFQIQLVHNGNNDVCLRTMIGRGIYGIQLSSHMLPLYIMFVLCASHA